MQGLLGLMIPVLIRRGSVLILGRSICLTWLLVTRPSPDMRCRESHFSFSELTAPLDSGSFFWQQMKRKGEGKWRLAVWATMRMIGVLLSDSQSSGEQSLQVMNFCLETFFSGTEFNASMQFECSSKFNVTQCQPSCPKKQNKTISLVLKIF